MTIGMTDFDAEMMFGRGLILEVCTIFLMPLLTPVVRYLGEIDNLGTLASTSVARSDIMGPIWIS